MIFAWVILSFFLGSPESPAGPVDCDGGYGVLGAAKKKLSVFDRLEEIDPRLAEALNNVHQLNPNLISGEVIPKWHDLELLDSILRSIRAGKAGAAKSGKLKKLAALVPDLAKYAAQNKDLRRISTAGNLKAALIGGYKPTEYELKRLYQHKLWEINRELPPPLKIRGARIPFDQRRNSLAEEARAFIKNHEKKYQALYPTTGFRNRQALVKAIEDQGAKAKAALDMLEKEEVDFVIRRPDNGRWWIPKVGFQNQRVSGSSKGTLSTDQRDSVEAFLTFGKKSQFEKLDNDFKPKYGYLRPKQGQVFEESRGTTLQYGEDAYILKKDNLRERTTWTAGDSLGRGLYKTEFDMPQIWHDAFTPWSNRELIVPVLLPDGGIDRKFRVRKPNFAPGSPLGAFPDSLPNDRYFEMQFWGPVTLDDVEAFEFSNAPPTGEFLQELRKRKIKIFDATMGKPKVWKPGRSEK